ncbi:MAG: penicillin-binding transpeptidase domain-containing protein [Planctomycetota bacterium]
MAAIANGGTIVRPHLRLDERLESPLRQLNLPSRAIETVRKGMWAVVNERGTGQRAAFKTLEVCGKSGTADWRKGATPHAWFAAYAPMDDPQIVAVVLIPEGDLGGATCAPIVKRLLEAYFNIHEGEGAVG